MSLAAKRLAVIAAAVAMVRCHAVLPYERGEQGVDAPRDTTAADAPGEGAVPRDLSADPGSAEGGTKVELVATADAQIEENFPDTNDSADDRVKVRSKSGTRRRALFRFDLPAELAGAAITRASLRLCLLTPEDHGLSVVNAVHRVTTTWQEAAVTWNTQPAVVQLSAPTWTVPNQQVCLTIDVAADVQLWAAGSAPNHGWMATCLTPDIGDIPYGAREHGDLAMRPLLAVEYR